jgi:maltose alpha-D-glucosyltransferase/alpha-amylase
LPGEGLIDEDRAAKAEAWADYWNASVGQAFLGSYLAVAAGHAFIPEDGAEHRILLDAFLLEKALYEIAYELNNRPRGCGFLCAESSH